MENRIGKKKKNRRFRRKKDINLNNETEHSVDGDINNNEVEVDDDRLRGKVKNISSRILTEHERNLLELGPKFCLVEHRQG